MKKALFYLCIFISAFLNYPVFAEETGVRLEKTIRTGKVNLALVTSLHPEMALFDFKRMAFLRVETGLSYDEFTDRQAELKAKGADKDLHIKLKEVDERMTVLAGEVRDLISLEKTNNPQRMSPASGKEFFLKQQEMVELDWKKRELSFSIGNPEFSTPSETRERLGLIEKEILAAVKEVSEEGGFDLVLNVSVPVSLGYPVRYLPGALYSTGPAGIDHTLFYGFMADNRKNFEGYADREDFIRKWISITGRPEAVEMLPLRPHPLVLHGGESITLTVLEKVYLKRKVEKDLLDHLVKILVRMGLH